MKFHINLYDMLQKELFTILKDLSCCNYVNCYVLTNFEIETYIFHKLFSKEILEYCLGFIAILCIDF